MVRIEDMVKEARETGSCYVGSWQEDFAVRTGTMVAKIERYARKHRIVTDYSNANEECWLIVK